MTRYSRYGDVIDEADDADDVSPEHEEICVGGWLGEDHLGRPIPCLQCRPHLRERWP